MTKKVWLEGHPFDLQALAELLSSGDPRVVPSFGRAEEDLGT